MICYIEVIFKAGLTILIKCATAFSGFSILRNDKHKKKYIMETAITKIPDYVISMCTNEKPHLSHKPFYGVGTTF